MLGLKAILRTLDYGRLSLAVIGDRSQMNLGVVSQTTGDDSRYRKLDVPS